MKVVIHVYITDDDGRIIATFEKTWPVDLNKPQGSYKREEMRGV